MAAGKIPNTDLSLVDILIKLSHVLVIFGFVLHLIGFATPFWRVLPFRWISQDDEDKLIGFDEGLWRNCANGICSDIQIVGRDWLQVVRAFESLALIGSLVAITTVLIQMFVNKLAKNRIVILLSVGSCFATAVFMLMAIITYGASVDVGVSWSFGLATVGGILIGVAGALLLVAFIKKQSAPF